MKINFVEDSDIVDLESAKYLKSIGFDKPTYHYYLDKDLSFNKKGLKRVKLKSRRINHNKYDDFIYSAPSKDELIKFKTNADIQY